MTEFLRRGHPAMNTWFEAILAGEDVEHLDAVASAVFEEIDRVEKWLSRFDSTSEISRLNREAFAKPVRVSPELLEILSVCQRACDETGGAFDVTASLGAASPSRRSIEIDPSARTVKFSKEDMRLDLGGFGKGYALDSAAAIVRAQGVENALLHGGTSSIRAVGPREWAVGVRDPFQGFDEAPELFQVALGDRGFSCSAVFGHNDQGQGTSDLIDPRRGQRLEEPAACVVLAGTAARAEVWSTALLAMGHDEAERFTVHDIEAIWIAPGPRWEWIVGTR